MTGGVDVQLAQVDLSVITVGPGDTLVITARDALSPEVRQRLAETLGRTFPGRKTVVLDAGLKLGIIREQDIE